jgi:hypothetical protein
MCWIIASAKSERNRREQREFEQKAAKEAKIWADNMGGRKFAGVVISAGSEQVGSKGQERLEITLPAGSTG